MRFSHYDLGQLTSGKTVIVSLAGNAVNVKLMDNNNFQSYRNGRGHKYFGGLAKQSSVRLVVPEAGHWHLAIDFAGLKGNVRTSVRVV